MYFTQKLFQAFTHLQVSHRSRIIINLQLNFTLALYLSTLQFQLPQTQNRMLCKTAKRNVKTFAKCMDAAASPVLNGLTNGFETVTIHTEKN